MPSENMPDLAREFAVACLSKDADAIEEARAAILEAAQETQDLRDALELVNACPGNQTAVTSLAKALKSKGNTGKKAAGTKAAGNGKAGTAKTGRKSAPRTGGTVTAAAIGPEAKAGSFGHVEGDVFFGVEDPRAVRERVLRKYLDQVVTKFSALPSFMKLAQKKVGADARDDRKAPRLAKVFVSLEVDPRNALESAREHGKGRGPKIEAEGEVKRVPVIREIAAHSRIVILGEPGSGKSTVARHLCRALAARDEECLADWPANSRPSVPVFVNLRDLARLLPEREERQAEDEANGTRVNLVWELLKQHWQRDRLEVARMEEALEAALSQTQPPGTVFFMDGLDEVRPDHRARVAKILAAWADRYPHARLVVTCRVRSYQPDSPWRLPFAARTLLPFTLKEQVPRFVEGWFAELETADWLEQSAGVLSTDLLRAIDGRPELRELAPSPLLLTMMSLVHGREERLPPGKALLYDRLVNLLLWEWEESKREEAGKAASEGLRALLAQTDVRKSATEEEVKGKLAGLVFQRMRLWARQGRRNREDELLLPEADLRGALMLLHSGCQEAQRAWAQQVIDLIRQRSGLLMEVDDKANFAFPHKTLAEFLCAFWLAEHEEPRETAFLDFCGTLEVWDDWREMGLLAAGYLAREGKASRVLHCLQSLAPDTPLAKKADARPQIVVAGEMLLEVGERAVHAIVPTGATLWRRTQSALRKIAENGWLPPVERARAGACLGWMGDDRPGVLDFDGIDQADSGFWSARISAGPFPMGNDEAHGRYDDERPRHECAAITRDYVISRHPITVAQYAAFMDAGGYREEKWWKWSRRAWNWVQKEGISRPAEYGPDFETPNWPRVGVSWCEAVAFCVWLAAEKGLPTLRLPTEAEWERAARHTNARLYPWGAADWKDRANIANVIGRPSSVGLFPKGRAECGAVDLAGNVWEWTLSPFTSDYGQPAYAEVDANLSNFETARVLRGGAFNNVAVSARCASRHRNLPQARLTRVGFRVVASPF